MQWILKYRRWIAIGGWAVVLVLFIPRLSSLNAVPLVCTNLRLIT